MRILFLCLWCHSYRVQEMKKKAKWESENIDTTVILDYVGVHSAFKIFFASAWKTFTIEELQLYTQLHIGLSCQIFFFHCSYKYCSFKSFTYIPVRTVNGQLPIGFAVGRYNALWFRGGSPRKRDMCSQNCCGVTWTIQSSAHSWPILHPKIPKGLPS